MKDEALLVLGALLSTSVTTGLAGGLLVAEGAARAADQAVGAAHNKSIAGSVTKLPPAASLFVDGSGASPASETETDAEHLRLPTGGALTRRGGADDGAYRIARASKRRALPSSPTVNAMPTAVPEPSVATLLVAGSLCLALVRRRSRG